VVDLSFHPLLLDFLLLSVAYMRVLEYSYPIDDPVICSQCVLSPLSHPAESRRSIMPSDEMSNAELAEQQPELRDPNMDMRQVPFRDKRPLEGPPPSCSWAAFQSPQLRKCPFGMATINWAGLIGGGLD